MKICELLVTLPALQKLGAQELPLKTLYKVSRVLKKLDDDLAFYNKQRQDLTVKYCIVRDGQTIPREEQRTEYDSKIKELLNFEIEFDDNERVTISMSENLVLSYNDLIALEKFIKFEE